MYAGVLQTVRFILCYDISRYRFRFRKAFFLPLCHLGTLEICIHKAHINTPTLQIMTVKELEGHS